MLLVFLFSRFGKQRSNTLNNILKVYNNILWSHDSRQGIRIWCLILNCSLSLTPHNMKMLLSCVQNQCLMKGNDGMISTEVCGTYFWIRIRIRQTFGEIWEQEGNSGRQCSRLPPRTDEMKMGRAVKEAWEGLRLIWLAGREDKNPRNEHHSERKRKPQLRMMERKNHLSECWRMERALMISSKTTDNATFCKKELSYAVCGSEKILCAQSACVSG